MKDKLTIIVVSAILIILGVVSGYFVGIDSGDKLGYARGYEKCGYESYEKGYSLGYDNGKEFVVTHLDQYVTVPKAVSYGEVVKFLKEDKISDLGYTDEFNCMDFSSTLKENAEKKGIKCAVVYFDLVGVNKSLGHAINAFETTDRGIVYFDPQTDGERFGIEVGGTYTLSERYKITKVDIIW